MLACRLDVQIGFDPNLTALSAIVAVAFTFAAFASPYVSESIQNSRFACAIAVAYRTLRQWIFSCCPEQDVEAEIRRDPRHLRQALVDRVDPHAAGQPREDAKVRLDLLRGDDQGLVGRRLRTLKGSIGDAREARRGGIHQRHITAAPSPEAEAEDDCREQCNGRRHAAAARRMGFG